MFGFFKKKKKQVRPASSNEVPSINETLKEVLPTELFPNNLRDVEAGTEMFLYIVKNVIEPDFAKVIFVNTVILGNRVKPFSPEKLKAHLNLFKPLIMNEVQFINLYNYLHTILTVNMLFKEGPVEIKRVEDDDPAEKELHYATNSYNTKYVVTEDEMPEWAADAPKVLLDLALKGIADNAQAGHYDEIPEGTGKFGWDLTNPIPVNGIPANNMYLSQLVTEEGGAITWQRKGSHSAANIGGMIDKYEIFDSKTKSLGFLYISPYHKKISTKAPAGFKFG